MKETIEQVTEQAHDAAIATRVQINEAREALKRRMRRARRQGGATLVEYALLVGVVSLALLAGAGALTGGVKDLFGNIGTALGGTNVELELVDDRSE